MSLLDGAGTVLLVHAHPDDETLSTGALAAELVARGRRVELLTATRGERGEVVAGPLAHLEGTEALAPHREGELRGACEELGIARLHWLGAPPARAAGLAPRRYRDSGMRWLRPGLAGPAADVTPDALCAAPLAEVAADIAALIGELRPALVVSYDPGGGYGHPDHVRVHDATVLACREHGAPFVEVLPEPADDGEWFVLEERRDAVERALRRHATQLSVRGAELVHSGGQVQPVPVAFGLRRR